MKYKWDAVKGESPLAPFMCRYCNTPTGVLTDERGEGHPFVRHHGLNLTPEGEWISAPGFAQPRVPVEQRELEELRCAVSDFCEQTRQARSERDAALARIAAAEELAITLDHPHERNDMLRILRGEA